MCSLITPNQDEVLLDRWAAGTHLLVINYDLQYMDIE